MTRLPFRSHAEQRVLLAACTTRTAPAPHLSRRRDRDRPVGFADVAAIPDPEWSRADRTAPRFSVAGLVPGGQAALASVPLPSEPEPELADWERELLALPVGEIPAATQRALAEESIVQELEDAAFERVLDDIDTVTADVAATLAARPELLHQHAVLMHLAPVVAWLKGAEL